MFDFENIVLAASVEEAVAALSANEKAIVISGGTDVLIKIREGKLAGCDLVSIHDIPELHGVRLTEDGCIHIGPTTTFVELTDSPIIMERIPVLGRAADTVGGPQIRAMGTVGGNISNGVTSADTATTLLNLEAELTLTSPAGERRVNVNDYYLGAGRVCLDHAELLTDICVKPENYQGFGGCYIKYAMRNAMDIATTGCSVNVRLSPDKQTFDRVRIAYGVAGPVPMRAPSAEALIQGKPLTMENAEAFSLEVLKDINPRDSWRAPKAFRQHIAVEMAKRCLIEATKRCGGEIK